MIYSKLEVKILYILLFEYDFVQCMSVLGVLPTITLFVSNIFPKYYFKVYASNFRLNLFDNHFRHREKMD